MDCPIARHPYRGTTDGLSHHPSPLSWDYRWTVPSPFTPIVVVCGTTDGLSHIARHSYRGGVWDVMDCPIARHSCRGGVWDYSWTVPSHVTRVVVVCGTIHGLSHRPSLPSWWCVGLFMDCPISHVTLIVVISRATDRIKPIHAPW